VTKLANTVAEPAYVQRLALTGSPFGAHLNGETGFFVSQSVRQNTLLALHLLRTTRSPVIVTGPKGVGKTTLVNALKQLPHADLKICVVDPESINFLWEAPSLKSVFGIDADPEQATFFQQKLIQLRAINQIPVIVIADLMKLNDSQQQTVQSWLSWKDEKQQPILQLLSSAETSPQWLAGKSQKLVLAPLLEEEVPLYLHQRLSAVGFKEDLPFTEKEISKIYRQSSGLPALINQSAHTYLMTRRPSAWHWPWKMNAKWAFRGFIFLLMSACLILIVTYQDRINNWLSSTEEQIVEPIALPDIESEIITPVTVQEPDSTEARNELANLLAEITAEGESETVGLTNEAEIQGAQSSEITSDDKPEIISYTRDWVLTRPSSHYTFQLMGSWDETEVTDFIEKYELSGKVARFTSLRDGQPWHVLLYGDFDSKQNALETSRQWKKPMSDLPTWLRRFDSVQNQIKLHPIPAE
jgi:DamX protein